MKLLLIGMINIYVTKETHISYGESHKKKLTWGRNKEILCSWIVFGLIEFESWFEIILSGGGQLIQKNVSIFILVRLMLICNVSMCQSKSIQMLHILVICLHVNQLNIRS